MSVDKLEDLHCSLVDIVRCGSITHILWLTIVNSILVLSILSPLLLLVLTIAPCRVVTRSSM